MSKIASIFRFSLSVAALLLAAPPAVQAADVDCSDKQISARGPGFEPSPELSMDAAKAAWLKKATEIYGDATVETAKDQQVMCASQGLYSNCTINRVSLRRETCRAQRKLTPRFGVFCDEALTATDEIQTAPPDWESIKPAYVHGDWFLLAQLCTPACRLLTMRST